jgi:hypothetical protein
LKPEPGDRLRKDNPAKHFITAFLVAAVLYVVAYAWIEHRRNRKGPWEVTFAGDRTPPEMVINQPWLRISNVVIAFPDGQLSLSGTQASMRFDQARPVPYAVPFGTCVFMDTTFLPGTVSFTNVFRHDIELLPRVLIIDRQEHSWKSGERIILR